MTDTICNNLQDRVSSVLSRHKSILDVISKYQESCARVNRAILKSATNCGCIQINAQKQEIPESISYAELNQYMSNHICGELCETCRDKIEAEIGNHLFYLASICDTLDLNLQEITEAQLKHIDTLGKFNLY